MRTVEDILKELPPDLQKQVVRFAEFLRQERAAKKQKRLRMTWAGGLREYRDQYTAMDLQQKALHWWGD
jgi:hypothetical protein